MLDALCNALNGSSLRKLLVEVVRGFHYNRDRKSGSLLGRGLCVDFAFLGVE